MKKTKEAVRSFLILGSIVSLITIVSVSASQPINSETTNQKLNNNLTNENKTAHKINNAVIYGEKEITVLKGKYTNLLDAILDQSKILAYDPVWGNISSKLKIETKNIDLTKVNSKQVTISVTGSNGKKITLNDIVLTVVDKEAITNTKELKREVTHNVFTQNMFKYNEYQKSSFINHNSYPLIKQSLKTDDILNVRKSNDKFSKNLDYKSQILKDSTSLIINKVTENSSLNNLKTENETLVQETPLTFGNLSFEVLIDNPKWLIDQKIYLYKGNELINAFNFNTTSKNFKISSLKSGSYTLVFPQNTENSIKYTLENQTFNVEGGIDNNYIFEYKKEAQNIKNTTQIRLLGSDFVFGANISYDVANKRIIFDSKTNMPHPNREGYYGFILRDKTTNLYKNGTNEIDEFTNYFKFINGSAQSNIDNIFINNMKLNDAKLKAGNYELWLFHVEGSSHIRLQNSVANNEIRIFPEDLSAINSAEIASNIPQNDTYSFVRIKLNETNGFEFLRNNNDFKFVDSKIANYSVVSDVVDNRYDEANEEVISNKLIEITNNFDQKYPIFDQANDFEVKNTFNLLSFLFSNLTTEFRGKSTQKLEKVVELMGKLKNFKKIFIVKNKSLEVLVNKSFSPYELFKIFSAKDGLLSPNNAVVVETNLRVNQQGQYYTQSTGDYYFKFKIRNDSITKEFTVTFKSVTTLTNASETAIIPTNPNPIIDPSKIQLASFNEKVLYSNLNKIKTIKFSHSYISVFYNTIQQISFNGNVLFEINLSNSTINNIEKIVVDNKEDFIYVLVSNNTNGNISTTNVLKIRVSPVSELQITKTFLTPQGTDNIGYHNGKILLWKTSDTDSILKNNSPVISINETTDRISSIIDPDVPANFFQKISSDSYTGDSILIDDTNLVSLPVNQGLSEYKDYKESTNPSNWHVLVKNSDSQPTMAFDYKSFIKGNLSLNNLTAKLTKIDNTHLILGFYNSELRLGLTFDPVTKKFSAVELNAQSNRIDITFDKLSILSVSSSTSEKTKIEAEIRKRINNVSDIQALVNPTDGFLEWRAFFQNTSWLTNEVNRTIKRFWFYGFLKRNHTSFLDNNSYQVSLLKSKLPSQVTKEDLLKNKIIVLQNDLPENYFDIELVPNDEQGTLQITSTTDNARENSEIYSGFLRPNNEFFWIPPSNNQKIPEVNGTVSEEEVRKLFSLKTGTMLDKLEYTAKGNILNIKLNVTANRNSKIYETKFIIDPEKPTIDEANTELAKVVLDFTNKSETLASTLNKTSDFTSTGFDVNKYELEIKEVVPQTSEITSVKVTFVLKTKGSDIVSDEKEITMTGFKTPPPPVVTPTPDPIPPVVETKPTMAEANTELAKVVLDFTNKSETLASALNTTSNFTWTNFDTTKYELQIKSVMVSAENNTNVIVKFSLKVKDTAAETEIISDEREIILTGFQTPPVVEIKPTKIDADAELAKVELDFANKAETLASTLNTNSDFTSTNFDTTKYELEIKTVTVQANELTNLKVTFVLKVKGSEIVSDEKEITISGFQTPPVVETKPTMAEANTELAKVGLDFANKSVTLATTLNATSNFISTNFDTTKYELQIKSVMVSTENNTNVIVKFSLKVKDTAAETEIISNEREITITGFQTPPTPPVVTPTPEPTPPVITPPAPIVPTPPVITPVATPINIRSLVVKIEGNNIDLEINFDNFKTEDINKLVTVKIINVDDKTVINKIQPLKSNKVMLSFDNLDKTKKYEIQSIELEKNEFNLTLAQKTLPLFASSTPLTPNPTPSPTSNNANSNSSEEDNSNIWKIAVGVLVPLGIIFSAIASFVLYKRNKRK